MYQLVNQSFWRVPRLLKQL